jgi:GNAT superfamily N-acetyltransferase
MCWKDEVMDTEIVLRTIRRATPDEAQVLTDLTRRSKAHWGYDAVFMAKHWDELAVTAEQIMDEHVYLLEANGRICGYYWLGYSCGDMITLENLFIDPDVMRSGVGTALWLHALEAAASLGYRVMQFDSDPHAEGFYLKMGARRIGEKPAPQPERPDRVLPFMEMELTRRIQKE